MRCYTLTERDEITRGLAITRRDDGSFGVVTSSTYLPLEPKIDEHLRACEDALYKRAFGDSSPSNLLGEDTKALFSDEDAKDVLEEAIEGWFVDHLTLDEESNTLVSVPYDARETRCLLLVAPAIDHGGAVTYQSNVVVEEEIVRGRVTRNFAHIAKAAGVTKLVGDGDKNLLKLDAFASFRVYRQRCRSGWDECVVRWNGQVLRKKAFGGASLRRAA